MIAKTKSPNTKKKTPNDLLNVSKKTINTESNIENNINKSNENDINEFNLNCINKLSKLINNKKAIEICESILVFSERYCTINNLMPEYQIGVYETKFFEILESIDQSSPIYNINLHNKINNNEIICKNIPFMDAKDIFPENWEEIVKKCEYREYKQKNISSTNIYTCKKCNKKEHHISQLQTRSPDEPMTTFVSCNNCGLTFKF